MKKIGKIIVIESEEYFNINDKINYCPEIDIRDGNKNSLYYVDSKNYNLENIEELFKYLNDAEEMYNYADNSYVYVNGKYNKEYDEDSYISYHFNSIPSFYFESDEFALRFFNEDITPYFDNIFSSNNNVFFNIKNIDTIISILKELNWGFLDFFNIVSLNNVNLIDVLNEYNDNEKIILYNISNDYIDKDYFIDLLKKYKINKFYEKLDKNLPNKEETKSKGKI